MEEDVKQRFDQIDTRFEQMDARFEQMDARFEQMDARFEKIDARFEKMEARFDRFESVLASFGQLLMDIKESLEKEITDLRTEVREGFATVGKRLDRVEGNLIHLDGRMTILTQADIQTDRQLTDVQTRQHLQQQAIDDIYQRLRKLEDRKSA